MANDMDRYTPRAHAITEEEAAVETSRFMSKVYLWMTCGLALTAYVSMTVASSPTLLQMIFGNKMVFYGLLIAEVGMVLALSFLINRMNSMVAAAGYFLYAALTGATLASVFLIYTQQSIFQVFGITTFAFAGLSGFGYFTKRDLGPIGSFCSMGLFGMIGWGLLSMFFPSLMSGSLSPTYSIIGLIVFSGLTAYDTQKIKSMYLYGTEGVEDGRKKAIFGALTLYLDFVNLFLSLLRLMGRRN